MRRHVPDALVEHVDDQARRIRRQMTREFLRQHERRAQVGLQMRIPAGARRGQRVVALEQRCIVHQQPGRAERVRQAPDQRRGLILSPEIGP